MLKLSPDEAALLRAVSADRDADLPRLVYADYLDDHGRPERAEFIRAQVVLAREPTAHNQFHLPPRVDELLAANESGWLRELPKWAVGRRREYVRGFIEAFEMPAAPFLLYGPQLLDRTPVRWLALTATRRVFADVVRCGWLGEVPELWLDNERLGDTAVAELASAGWLSRVRVLNLDGNELGEPAARALAACRHLGGLEHLSLTDNRLTVAAVERLLASPHLTGCRLHLRNNPRLAADPHAVRRLLGPRGTL